MYSFPRSVTFAAFTIASAASTAPTKPLVSTIPSASKGISVSSLFLVVEIKVELLFLASTYHRAPEESRHQRSEVRDQRSVLTTTQFLNLRTSVYRERYV